MRDCPGGKIQLRKLLSEHDLGGDPGHGDVADLGDQGYCPRGPRIGFQYVDDIVGDGVLDVHKADNLEFDGDGLCVFIDRFQVLGGDADRRNDAGGIAGMDARQLDVLHDGRDKGVRSVRDGVGLRLDGVFQEFVDENGPLRGDPYGGGHIAFQHLFVMDDFHASAAQNVGRADHEGIADPVGDG
ncbi:MAG: hypothetical protein A4E66_02588 [Syntrophus sp. PtaB.Bin001]|nr:MAG: hypothetical protein A4E66_02588 [Syntrophus sp. PtaB.Bin001]